MWLLEKIVSENETTLLEVEYIHNQPAAFLTSLEKRGAHFGIAVLGGIGLFGKRMFLLIQASSTETDVGKYELKSFHIIREF